jgi:hypothetical protein
MISVVLEFVLETVFLSYMIFNVEEFVSETIFCCCILFLKRLRYRFFRKQDGFLSGLSLFPKQVFFAVYLFWKSFFCRIRNRDGGFFFAVVFISFFWKWGGHFFDIRRGWVTQAIGLVIF